MSNPTLSWQILFGMVTPRTSLPRRSGRRRSWGFLINSREPSARVLRGSVCYAGARAWLSFEPLGQEPSHPLALLSLGVPRGKRWLDADFMTSCSYPSFSMNILICHSFPVRRSIPNQPNAASWAGEERNGYKMMKLQMADESIRAQRPSFRPEKSLSHSSVGSERKERE